MDFRTAQLIVDKCGRITAYLLVISGIVALVAYNTGLVPAWLFWLLILITAAVMSFGIYINVHYNIEPEEDDK